MALPEPFGYFLDPLERLRLPYFVTGSVAAGLYGEPRLTRDIDIVLVLTLGNLARFLEAFPEEEFYVPPAEVIIEETRRGDHGIFNLIHHDTGFKADFMLASNDPLHLWAMRHKQRRSYSDGQSGQDHLWVSPPEYIILRKLEFFREGGHEKHVRDIQFMLLCTDVDRGFIAEHVSRLGLVAQWERCQLPPGV